MTPATKTLSASTGNHKRDVISSPLDSKTQTTQYLLLCRLSWKYPLLLGALAQNRLSPSKAHEPQQLMLTSLGAASQVTTMAITLNYNHVLPGLSPIHRSCSLSKGQTLSVGKQLFLSLCIHATSPTESQTLPGDN